jgi:hypothetical protein
MAVEDRASAVLEYHVPRRARAWARAWGWRLAVLVGLFLIAVLFCVVGISRQGTPAPPALSHWTAGKTEGSPDGRFQAEGLVHHDQRRSWCTMEVVEVASGRRIFYLEQNISGSDLQPRFDQGDVLNDGMEWAADSSAITFTGKNGEQFRVPVR